MEYLRIVIDSMNVKSIRCRMYPYMLTGQEYNMIKDDGYKYSFQDWLTTAVNPKSNVRVTKPIKSTFKLMNSSLYDKALRLIRQPCIACIDNGEITDLHKVEYLYRLVSRKYIEGLENDKYNPKEIWGS